MTATIERSLSRASSSISIPSPRVSVWREATPPVTTEPALFQICDHLNLLDSRVQDLRSTVLTKDSYVDRRNREDEYLRREFEKQRTTSNRIDLNVAALRADVDQLRSSVDQLKSSIGQSAVEATFLRNDIDHLQKTVDQVQTDLEQLHTDVCGSRIEISKLHSTISQLRTDMITLQHETSRHFSSIFNRFTTMESQMKHMERVRFNSLAHTVHAPITAVPVIDVDGSLKWPEYFPRTVWRFWCLKKRSRIHRLVELAEFYGLGGYQYWSHVHPSNSLFENEFDSSDSSDTPSSLSRAEAVRQYPEAAHQALAATLGLVYYKIRNEVGEGPNAQIQRPPKRPQADAVSLPSSKLKPVKMAGRQTNALPTSIQRFITSGMSLDAKSLTSEESDKLGWNPHSDASVDARSNLRGVVSGEIAMLLQALEQGHVKLKPSGSEAMNMSPTESKASSGSGRQPPEAGQDDDVPTIADTIATELITPDADHARPCTPTNPDNLFG